MSHITPQNCITCFGKKTFLWKGQDGAPVEYDCRCVEQYMLFRLLSHSGILLNYQRLGWADFEHFPDEAALQVGDYLDHKDAFLDGGFGLVVHGNKGNGKSLLGYLLTKNLIAEGIDCFATPFADMVEAFAGGWRDPAREQWFNRTIRNAKVLFIDDLGREYKQDRFSDAKVSEDEKRRRAESDNRPGSVKETLLESVIRHRTGSCLPTFLTTNYTPDDMLNGYGGHTMSLLAEKSIFVEVTGQDRRREMNAREQVYLRQGMKRPVTIS